VKKVLAGLLGGAVGFLVLGAAGYLYGELFLAWFGPRSCCGLEGLLSPIVGSLIGAILGALSGAMLGLLLVQRRPVRLVRLLLLLAVGVAVAYVASLVLGPQDIERVPPMTVFFAVTMILPTLIWVTDVWEKPDTSI
jgi:hypothetical protein